MKLSRSKNSIRNASYGLINKIVSILLPFIVRTVFIRTLGAEYLGLNSLFSSILTVLNLTELGFSSAIVFSMYKPIAEDDNETINALLAYYRKVYLYIGTVIMGIGGSLIPFLPGLINGSYPEGVNLTAIYIAYLINTVLSYFMFAYLQALISAFQREDLISKVNILVSIAMHVLQIVVLIKIRNYYVYVLIMPLFTIINNIRTAAIAKKYFPAYKPAGMLKREAKADIKEKVSGLVIEKVCSVSRNAFDSIFISMFLGLAETAMYNNYYYIMNAIVSIMAVPAFSIMAGAGNSVAVESVEKNYRDMNRMNFLYMWMSGWFSICLLCLYQPFMKLWAGEKLMFSMPVVILICLYFYVLKMGDICFVYIQATGLWWEHRYRAIAEAAANLGLNYFLGRSFGVCGIIAATLISLFCINFLYGSQIIFKYYFTEQKVPEYFGLNLVYGSATLASAIITFLTCKVVIYDGIGGFMIKALICAFIPNAVYWLLYRKTKMYQDAFPWLLGKLESNGFFSR